MQRLVTGSTYVPIEATMKYVSEQSKNSIYRCYTIRNDPLQIFNQFRPIWPVYLYPCQKYDGYGARFPVIPDLNPKKINDYDAMDNQTQMALWTTLGLLSCVQVIWDTICNVELNTSQWEGWILNFLSKNCFAS